MRDREKKRERQAQRKSRAQIVWALLVGMGVIVAAFYQAHRPSQLINSSTRLQIPDLLQPSFRPIAPGTEQAAGQAK